ASHTANAKAVLARAEAAEVDRAAGRFGPVVVHEWEVHRHGGVDLDVAVDRVQRTAPIVDVGAVGMVAGEVTDLVAGDANLGVFHVEATTALGGGIVDESDANKIRFLGPCDAAAATDGHATAQARAVV